MDLMKTVLLNVVEKLKTDGFDLSDPILFKWVYPEDPWIEYQLLIRELGQAAPSLENENVH